jgi:hypothetical protein
VRPPWPPPSTSWRPPSASYFPAQITYPDYLPVDNRASATAGQTVRGVIDAVQFPSDSPPTGFPGAPQVRLEGNQVAVLLRSDSLANVTAGANAICLNPRTQAGFNQFLHTTHRQNFLVPPRAHRSFPLAEYL